MLEFKKFEMENSNDDKIQWGEGYLRVPFPEWKVSKINRVKVTEHKTRCAVELSQDGCLCSWEWINKVPKSPVEVADNWPTYQKSEEEGIGCSMVTLPKH